MLRPSFMAADESGKLPPIKLVPAKPPEPDWKMLFVVLCVVLKLLKLLMTGFKFFVLEKLGALEKEF